MDIAEVSARIVASKGMAPLGAQRELLEQVAEIHRRLEVLDGDFAPSLIRACSYASACWKEVAVAKRPRQIPSSFDIHSENGCIFLPWVGPSYARGGICVVGTNLHRHTDEPQWEYALEQRIALDPKWGQVPELRRGKKRIHKSLWAYRTMRDVVAVQRSMAGEVELDASSGNELAEAMLSSARIQAVKCSPVGHLSTPTSAMSEQCPRRFLSGEISVLRPSVLLVYGNRAREGVARIGNVEWAESKRRFRRGSLQRSDFVCDVFFLAHPAALHGAWSAAHEALKASLKRRPAGAISNG